MLAHANPLMHDKLHMLTDWTELLQRAVCCVQKRAPVAVPAADLTCTLSRHKDNGHGASVR